MADKRRINRDFGGLVSRGLEANRPVTCDFLWWPGPGSNRRPSAFQADARTN
jgi:hypothetical protein